MNSSLAVANAFIELAKRDDVALSNMKLQKLIYFAQGHSLGLQDKQLVDEFPEAWTYGPVYPRVYHEFKQYGAQAITKPSMCPFPDEEGCYDWPSLNDWDQMLVEAVWKAYKDKTPIQLSELSHLKDGPWARARARAARGSEISREDMKSFFAPKKQDAN